MADRDHFAECEAALIGQRWTVAQARQLILLIQEGAAVMPLPKDDNFAHCPACPFGRAAAPFHRGVEQSGSSPAS